MFDLCLIYFAKRFQSQSPAAPAAPRSATDLAQGMTVSGIWVQLDLTLEGALAIFAILGGDGRIIPRIEVSKVRISWVIFRLVGR